MVINGAVQVITLRRERVRLLGDRHRGVGFDQLLHIKEIEGNSADFELAIYNSDGEIAQQCGNGTLCVARFVYEEKLTTKPKVVFKTPGGVVEARVLGSDAQGNKRVCAKLGVPTTDPSRVPFVADSPRLEHEINLDLKATPSIRVIPVGMGNPHAVVLTADLPETNLEQVAYAIQSHERFPDSVNVEFVKVLGPASIRLRVFERGVGETMACGTGACAAVTAARLAGQVDSQVSVNQIGGTVSVDWPAIDQPISLIASATRVFDGDLQLD